MDEQPQGRKSAPDEVWAVVREEYLAGRSAGECCRRHGVGLTALRDRAAREGWRRSDQAWRPPSTLDPWDEGVELELQVGGDLDKVETCQLWYVARRRMLRAVMRGDAAEALRWRRVERILDEVEAETDRMTEEHEALLWHAENRRWAEEQDLREADDPDSSDSSDGVLESGDSSPPHLDGEVDASPSRADGGGDPVRTGEYPAALAQTTVSPPPSRREAAPRHLPTEWGGEVKPELT